MSPEAIVVTNHYPKDLSITKRFLNHFNVKPSIDVELDGHAYVFKTKYQDEAFIHILNFESYPVSVSFKHDDMKPLKVMGFDNVMLPLRIKTRHGIITSNSELTKITHSTLTFRTQHHISHITIQTSKMVISPYCVKEDAHYVCQIPKHGEVETTLIIQ